MENRNALVPGALCDNWNHKYAVGRRYPATPRQVNSIIKASESYADGGYNFYTRNCTTFVKEMIADVAKLDTGGTIFEKEYVRNNYKSNFGRTIGGFTDFFSLPRTRQNLARKSAKPDLTYRLLGQKSVTKMDVENFNKSESILSIPQKGYIPAVGAENARRLKGKDSGVLESYLYLGKNMGEDVEHAKLNLDILTSAISDTTLALQEDIKALIPEEELEDIYSPTRIALSKVVENIAYLGTEFYDLQRDMGQALRHMK